MGENPNFRQPKSETVMSRHTNRSNLPAQITYSICDIYVSNSIFIVLGFWSSSTTWCLVTNQPNTLGHQCEAHQLIFVILYTNPIRGKIRWCLSHQWLVGVSQLYLYGHRILANNAATDVMWFPSIGLQPGCSVYNSFKVFRFTFFCVNMTALWE